MIPIIVYSTEFVVNGQPWFVSEIDMTFWYHCDADLMVNGTDRQSQIKQYVHAMILHCASEILFVYLFQPKCSIDI